MQCLTGQDCLDLQALLEIWELQAHQECQELPENPVLPDSFPLDYRDRSGPPVQTDHLVHLAWMAPAAENRQLVLLVLLEYRVYLVLLEAMDCPDHLESLVSPAQTPHTARAQPEVLCTWRRPRRWWKTVPRHFL